MKSLKPLIGIFALTVAVLASPAYSHLEFFDTSFEFDEPGTFDIGTAPLRATFSGGAAQVIGVGAYYRTGTHSWHVPDDGLSTVTFEMGADQVDFWFRDTVGAASSTYRIYDTSNIMLAFGSGTQTFAQVVLTRTGQLSRIGRIEFSSAGGGDTVVDDFSYAADEDALETNITLLLEEPISNLPHGGVGNLRGWAVSPDGIDRIEIYIDGAFAFEAPYGGNRTDVGAAFPAIEGSDSSGFSLAFGYSNLSAGEHSITARAYSLLGAQTDSSSTFNVVTFDKTFITSSDVVNASDATITAAGDEITIQNISIDERVYNLKLKWRSAEQGFEIIEIE